MTEWLYEAGIGETRAALIEDNRIVEARIELEDAGPLYGSTHAARLGTGWRDRRVVDLEGGGEAFLDRLREPASDGASLFVEVTREAVRGPRETKLAHVRHRLASDAPTVVRSLRAELAASGHVVRNLLPYHPDALEAVGWGEVLDAAATGFVAFDGGVLHIEATRAMTVIDIDGAPPLDALALASARAAARAIRQLGIAGSIAVDFPTLSDRAARQRVGEAFDEASNVRAERTAINGFGLMQVVREKRRASLLELVQGDPAGAAARALLRTAQRSGAGGRTLVVPPVIGARLREAHGWLDRLAASVGGAVGLRVEASLAMSSGYVEPA